MQLEAIVDLVQPELDKVDNLINTSLQSQVPLAIEISKHLIYSGGKRLRPISLLLAAGACQNTSDKHITLAAIVELIHTATLLHDDVVDHSSQRRGQSTANMVWGNAAPVLVGDFLYSRAFQMMVSLESNTILQILAQGTNTIAEGEILQLANKHNPMLSESDYEKIIHAKTAKLFEIATQLGALVAEASDQNQSLLKQYGCHLGTAFQLMDDVLDYQAPADVMGKNVGDDLADGKTTLPLLYALKMAKPAQKEIICKAIREGQLENLEPIQETIKETGAIEFTLERAFGEVDQAKACLMQLPASPYTEALSQIADFSVRRDN